MSNSIIYFVLNCGIALCNHYMTTGMEGWLCQVLRYRKVIRIENEMV